MSYQKYEVRVYSTHTDWFNEQGQLHRLDGPAIEYRNGDKEWYINGKRHRIDGPAIEYPSGYKAWYENGILHRKDGPAREWVDGGKQWWLLGKRFSEEDFKKCISRFTCEGKTVEIDGQKYKLTKV